MSEWKDVWPPLVYKCFTDENLMRLAALRQAINESDADTHARDFMKLALTATAANRNDGGRGMALHSAEQASHQEG